MENSFLIENFQVFIQLLYRQAHDIEKAAPNLPLV